jgi:hypothetical protein
MAEAVALLVREDAPRRTGQIYSQAVLAEAGIPVPALVSAEDLPRLQQFDREREARTRAIERFSQAFADVPPEEAEAEVARIIAERRQRRSAEVERQSA